VVKVNWALRSYNWSWGSWTQVFHYANLFPAVQFVYAETCILLCFGKNIMFLLQWCYQGHGLLFEMFSLFCSLAPMWCFCNILKTNIVPSVLWHCWLGIRKNSMACKHWLMKCRRGYLSGARCRLFAYGLADVTASKKPIISCFIMANTYGRRAFSVAGPLAWNSLPDFIRDPTSSTDCFRRLLITFLFARY